MDLKAPSFQGWDFSIEPGESRPCIKKLYKPMEIIKEEIPAPLCGQMLFISWIDFLIRYLLLFFVRIYRNKRVFFFLILILSITFVAASPAKNSTKDHQKASNNHIDHFPPISPKHASKKIPVVAPVNSTELHQEFLDNNVTGNPGYVPQTCDNSRAGSDCQVLVDFTTSAVVLSGDQVSFVEGGCGNPVVANPNGLYTGLVPCSNGKEFTYGDCTFTACLQKYGDPVNNDGTFETDGNLIVFTCRGEGTFLLITEDTNVNINYKLIFQYQYPAKFGMNKIQWSCGTGLKTQDIYVSKRAICKSSKMGLACLNENLSKAALAFVIFLAFSSLSFLEMIDPFAWVMTVVLVIPFLYIYYRAHKKSIAETTMEYMKLSGKCPLCLSIVADPAYHIEHCPKNLKGHLSEQDLRSWMFFRRLLHFGNRIAYFTELSILILLLIFVVINVDTVGAVDVSSILDAPSKDCSPFVVGESNAVATFVNGRTCTGTTCVGSVDIDTTLDGLEGFTQRFSLGEGLFLDIRVKQAFYKYTVARQYDACDSDIVSSSTSSCGGDGCDVCKTRITNYQLYHDEAKTNEWACNGDCIHIQRGCTCGSCGHVKKGDCYMVGQTAAVESHIILNIQSGGKCAEFDIAMESKSNKVLISQLSEENKLNDMVAIKDKKVYSGTINRLGEFGGFGDLKFKTDTDVECKDNQNTQTQCTLGHVKTYSYTHCCSDTYFLKDQLAVRADWVEDKFYYIQGQKTGTFRTIINIPAVPITRNPADVSLTLECKFLSGCFSCAPGATLELKATASGPGWFDVAVEGGNIRPNQLNVNKDENKATYTVFLGQKVGTAIIHVGQYNCKADFNLDNPGSDAIDTGNNDLTNNPKEVCGFTCDVGNLFHMPNGMFRGILKGLFITSIVLFVIFSIILIRRAYRYEKTHHAKVHQDRLKEMNDNGETEPQIRRKQAESELKPNSLGHWTNLLRQRKNEKKLIILPVEEDPIIKENKVVVDSKTIENDDSFLQELLDFRKSSEYANLPFTDKMAMQKMINDQKKSK